MILLKYGSRGVEVIDLQNLLNEWDYQLKVDGEFGDSTLNAVRDFQKSVRISADGMVGKNTWRILKDRDCRELRSLYIKEADYIRAAEILGVDVAVIKAVREVETEGRGGFLKVGVPTILFEGHIFWRELIKSNLSPKTYIQGAEDILYEKWTKVHYKGGIKEYDRLHKAININKDAAYRSASWGAFQIMGFNHNLCGCSTINTFVSRMNESEGSQLDLFVEFIKTRKIDHLLRDHNWAGFAKYYNGPGYGANHYDTLIKAAYEKYSI